VRPIDGLGDLPGVHDVSLDGPRTRFNVDQGELNRVLERLVALDVRTLVSSPPTLEELFLRHYGDDIATAREDADLAGVR
jgi:ABC-2 type transport system ATP-binding protein